MGVIVHSRSAVISPCGTYRYTLSRGAGGGRGMALFVLSNPSIADAEADDPTARRGVGFATGWGFGRMMFANTNPHRSTDPDTAIIPPEPVLIMNDEYIRACAFEADMIVCAWGTSADPALAARALDVLRSVGKPLHHMGLTKDGIPRHPLYLHSNTKPELWA